MNFWKFSQKSQGFENQGKAWLQWSLCHHWSGQRKISDKCGWEDNRFCGMDGTMWIVSRFFSTKKIFDSAIFRAIPSKGNTAEIVLTVLHRNFLGVDEFLGRVPLPLSNFDHHDKPKSRYLICFVFIIVDSIYKDGINDQYLIQTLGFSFCNKL